MEELQELSDELCHYGVQGQKWGVRRYQNPDGSLTEEGQLRYNGKTHINQLDQDEKDDLRYQEAVAREEKERSNKKKLAIAGIAAGTVLAAGVAFVAAKLSSQKTQINIQNQQQQATLAKNTLRAERAHATKLAKISSGINPNAKVNNFIQNNGNMSVRDIGNVISNITAVKHSDDDENYEEEVSIDELFHHGIKGQKWGVRRFQDMDGSLTKEGKARYRKDLGTKEMIKNTTDYDKLTKKQQKQYIDYSRKAGARRGAIVGAVAGAGIGVARKAAGLYTDKQRGYVSRITGQHTAPSGSSVVRQLTRSAFLGAIGGTVVGTLIGGSIGKRKGKAQLADKGKEYVDELLNTPVDRLSHSEDFSDILMHHGIEGQKWGVRRYQYADGSLTPEGRKRYNPDAPDTIRKRNKPEDGKPTYYYIDKDGKEREYKYNVKQLDYNELVDLQKQIQIENKLNEEVAKKQPNTAKDAQDALNSSAKVLDATVKALPAGNGRVVKKNYSELSDQELRNRISRLQLEESYGRLTGDTKYVKSGSDKAREILQTTGAVVAIGASAAGLAYTIGEIMDKRKQAISK